MEGQECEVFLKSNLMSVEQEITLAKVRLHWGIFIPALLLGFAPMLLWLAIMFPIIFFIHGMFYAIGQNGMPMNQTSGLPGLQLIWLIPVTVVCMILFGVLLATWLAYSKSEVILTNRRLLFRTGILSRRSGELPLENVESIYISEPLIGRMFGYGTVMVTSVGGARFPLSFIGSPQGFHSMLQKAVADAKSSARGIPKPPEARPPPRDDDARYRPKK